MKRIPLNTAFLIDGHFYCLRTLGIMAEKAIAWGSPLSFSELHKLFTEDKSEPNKPVYVLALKEPNMDAAKLSGDPRNWREMLEDEGLSIIPLRDAQEYEVEDVDGTVYQFRVTVDNLNDSPYKANTVEML